MSSAGYFILPAENAAKRATLVYDEEGDSVMFFHAVRLSYKEIKVNSKKAEP